VAVAYEEPPARKMTGGDLIPVLFALSAAGRSTSASSASLLSAHRPTIVPLRFNLAAASCEAPIWPPARPRDNKLICQMLNLAEPKLKNHVTAILKALKVYNRTEAVIAVNELGWNLLASQCDFTEALVLYWLSKHEYECAHVDPTSIDLIACKKTGQNVWAFRAVNLHLSIRTTEFLNPYGTSPKTHSLANSAFSPG
jgi:hypothetical protein